MVGIDTNILVRIFTQDNPQLTKQAQQIIDDAEPGKLLLDRIVIAELGYVLVSRYAYDKQDVCKIYTSLLAYGTFYVPDRELVELTVKLFASEKPLSFEDCWLLALKRSGKVKSIATFDTSLIKSLT